MSALESCIRRACRRYLSLLIFEQAATAIALAMAGAILLLVLGTQILNWYWPVLLFAVSFGVGLYRTCRRIPSSYVLAQKIDQRLALHDTLSTAVHFSGSTSNADRQLIEAQRVRAERAACDVVLVEAIPFRMPVSAYASVALLVITGTLFGVRYGMRNSLDLSQPMVSFAFDTFRVDDTVASAQRKKTPEQQRLEEQLQGLSVSPDQQNPQDFGEAPDSALNTVDTPDVNDFPQDAMAKSQQKLSSSEVKAAGEEGSEQPGESGEETGEQAANQNGADGNNPQGAPQAKNASPQQGNQGENSSLMDKMRDALANLMQKMKMPQKPGGSQQTASSKPGQQGNQSQQSMSEKGTPQPGTRQQGDSQSSDADGEQQGEGGEQADNGQSRQGTQGADQQASKDAKSGMGKQDGNKEVQLAEQLEAMGKISEIFGKRAQNLTGEVMVEVAAGKQQLRTQYSERSASHSDAGGEIHRDEIPLVYQHYVQQYFEQIRNTPEAKAGSEKKTPPAPEAKPKPIEGVPAQARP